MPALALDSTSRLCIRCAEPAEIAASFNQWTCVWEMQDGINVPEVEMSKLWCKGCFREARPVNCPMCGKDALEDTGDNLAVNAGLFWIVFGTRCRRCKVPARAALSITDRCEFNAPAARTDASLEEAAARMSPQLVWKDWHQKTAKKYKMRGCLKTLGPRYGASLAKCAILIWSIEGSVEGSIF